MANIYFVANMGLPTIKAHGFQIAKMCEAFAKTGINCELILPKRSRYPNTGKSSILEYYGIRAPFKVTELGSLNLTSINLGLFLNKILFWIQQSSFSRSLKKYLIDKEGIVYSRDQFSLGILDSQKHRLYWEAHNLPRNINSLFYKKILGKISGLVVISQGLKEDFGRCYKGPVLVAPDAVDLEEFNLNMSTEEARKKLNLPLDKKLVVYTGHLYKWKGADALLEAAKLITNYQLPITNGKILFVFVGGTEEDVENFRKKADIIKDVLVLGHQPHPTIPLYLKAADVLVLPNTGKEDISRKYTSPLKLFEYMASGRPIVASDLPSTREILDDSNSILVESDNAEKLAVEIRNILNNPEPANRICEKALEDVKNFTWSQRAEKILKFIDV